jgi:hypothetical protein
MDQSEDWNMDVVHSCVRIKNTENEYSESSTTGICSTKVLRQVLSDQDLTKVRQCVG